MAMVVFLIAMAILGLGLLIAIPVMTFQIPTGIAVTIIDICSKASYFLPIKILMPIILFSITLNTVRFVFNIVLRVKSFIPTMGD